MSLQPESQFDIPKEVLDAAILVGKHMKMCGAERWELFDICSRNYAYDLQALAGALKVLKSIE